jgi:hypothetical protein
MERKQRRDLSKNSIKTIGYDILAEMQGGLGLERRNASARVCGQWRVTASTERSLHAIYHSRVSRPLPARIVARFIANKVSARTYTA